MSEMQASVAHEDLRQLDILVEESGNLPPEEPSLSPPDWIKANLFSTPFNGFLTLIAGAFALWAIRALLGFTFSPIRVWRAPATNARLLGAGVYPEAQFHRVWVLLAIAMALAGLTMGILKAGGPFSIKRLAIWLMSTGAFLCAAIFLTPTGYNLVEDDGTPIPNPTWGSVVGTRIWPWLIISLLILGVGLALWYGFGEVRRRSTFIPFLSLIFGAFGLIALALWVIPFGHFALKDGVFINEPDRTVALTTKLPFTLSVLAMFVFYAIGRAIGPRLTYAAGRSALGIAWVLLPFIGIFVILRDPNFDYSYVARVDIPMFLAFAIGGGIVLWFLSKPNLGEKGRLIAVALVALSIFHWVSAFFGWYPMLQKARISFLLLGLVALVAHNFAGDRKTRARFVTIWVLVMVMVHYLATVINTESTLDINQSNFIEGLILSLVVAVFSILFSFPLGLMLALGRTSTMPIFRQLSTLYIEFVRGVPLVTLLFFFDNILPLFLPGGMDVKSIAAATAAFALFSAAYLAENVRGGLQSIRRGQFEAADALGLTTSMRTSFIIIPQALRASIPQLVGQTIASFKETSLILIIGSLDLLLIARNAIPNQTEFFGIKKEGLLVVCAIYFIGAFAMSKYSQKLEKRLGVGER